MNEKESEFNAKIAKVLLMIGGFTAIFIPVIGCVFMLGSISLTKKRETTDAAHTFIASLITLIATIIIFIISVVNL